MFGRSPGTDMTEKNARFTFASETLCDIDIIMSMCARTVSCANVNRCTFACESLRSHVDIILSLHPHVEFHVHM